MRYDYKPRNYKVGDKIVCIKPCQNHYVNEEIVLGQKYIVGRYDKGNTSRKGYLQIKGCRVFWDDDDFELVEESETIDK